MHELPAVVAQPQLMLEVRHLSRDGGGQAVQGRDLHRAGAQVQQHCCVHYDTAAYTIAVRAAKTWLQKKEL